MDITTISQVANSPAAYLILAVIVSVTAYKFFVTVFNRNNDEKQAKDEQIKQMYQAQTQDAKEREDKLHEHQKQLLAHLDRSNESQERTADAIERINCSLDTLNDQIKGVHNRVDGLQQQIEQGGIQ